MRGKPGVRTHILLVVAMAVIIAVVTGLSLLLIRHHLRNQVTSDLSTDLDRSAVAFQDLQAERLATLEREDELLSRLPTLKALMTSGDDLTIQNEGAEFWRMSGADLFVLTDAGGRVVAGYTTKGAAADAALGQGVKALLAAPGKHYLIVGGSLYACSLRPLYFGSDHRGHSAGICGERRFHRADCARNQPTRRHATPPFSAAARSSPALSVKAIRRASRDKAPHSWEQPRLPPR